MSLAPTFLTSLHVQSGVTRDRTLALTLAHWFRSFREKSVALDKDDVIQVKEAFKWILQGQVAKELGGVAVVTRVGRRPHEQEKILFYLSLFKE